MHFALGRKVRIAYVLVTDGIYNFPYTASTSHHSTENVPRGYNKRETSTRYTPMMKTIKESVLTQASHFPTFLHKEQGTEL